MKRNIILLVGCTFLIATQSPIVNGQTPSQPVPSSFFGMHIGSLNLNWPNVDIGALAKGSRSGWADVEPNAPVNGVHSYNWSVVDHLVYMAQTHGAEYYWSNSSVPRWAVADPSTCAERLVGQRKNITCTGMVANIADWDAFTNALVTRYRGQIKTYELWNKPDDPTQWTGTIADMVLLTAHLHNTIRDIDHCASISSPSMDGNHTAFMDNFWASGGTRDVDIVSFRGNAGSIHAESIDGPLSRGARSLMDKYGLSAKSLWDIEAQPGASLTPDQLEAFIAVDYILHWSSGITRLYWHGWDVSGPAMLTGTSAARAYEQVYKWLHNSSMSTCSLNGAVTGNPVTTYNAVYTCPLMHGSANKILVWNSGGSSHFTVPSGYTRYLDLAGTEHEILANTVPIGIKPILLEH